MKQLVQVVSVFHKLGFPAALVPLVKELTVDKLTEKGDFSDFFVKLELMNHLFQGYDLSVGHHTASAHSDKVLPLLALVAYLELVYSSNFHVQELVGVGFLQQGDDFWYCKDLVLDQEGKCLMD
jgi:hypothetical protein